MPSGARIAEFKVSSVKIELIASIFYPWEDVEFDLLLPLSPIVNPPEIIYDSQYAVSSPELMYITFPCHVRV